MEIKTKIETLEENDVCLFMKGTPDNPQCDFHSSFKCSNI